MPRSWWSCSPWSPRSSCSRGANQREVAQRAALSVEEQQQITAGEQLARTAKVGDYLVTVDGMLLEVRESYLDDTFTKRPKVFHCAQGVFGRLPMDWRTTRKIQGVIPGVGGTRDPKVAERCQRQYLEIVRD